MKKIKICTPVIGKTLNEFLNNLEKVQGVSDMVELRVDNINNLSEEDLRLIRNKTKKKSIFTCRKKELILSGFKLGFDYVDIDLGLIKDLDLSKTQRSKTILSFHNFKKTPEIKELTLIINRMRKCNVEVLKIATPINSKQDIKNLIQILLNKGKNEKMIIIGMGQKGKITRILGPLLGSFLTFASTKFGESAPGQMDVEGMKNIYKLLVPNL